MNEDHQEAANVLARMHQQNQARSSGQFVRQPSFRFQPPGVPGHQQVQAGDPSNHVGHSGLPNETTQLLSVMTALLNQNAELIRTVSNNLRSTDTHHYNILPDLSHNIQDFDGLSGPSSATVWIRQLESTATLHRWTEAVAFETARSHLTKAAKNWYLANLDVIKDWASFRTAFNNTFIIEKSLTERWQEMQARNQKPNEDSREYYFDKIRLCKALNFSFDESKTQIAIGLWSRNTSAAIMSQSHLDYDDLLQSIVNFESLEAARRQRIGARQDHPKQTTDGKGKIFRGNDSRSRDSRSETSQPNIKQQSTEDRQLQERINRPEVECYRCHSRGHVARNCPVPREIKCYRCNEVGHIATNCSKPKNLSNADIKFLEPESENNVNKYCKKIKIGNVDNLHALIDSGSSDCLIKASLVLENDFKFIRISSSLVGFGRIGNEVKSSGVISESLSVDECTVSEIKFRVVPDDVMPYDVLIGRNFTELPEIVYYKADNQLKFCPREKFIFKEFSVIDNREPYEIIKNVDEIVISQASINFVQVQVGEKEFRLPITNIGDNEIKLDKNRNLNSVVFNINDNVPELKPRVEPILDKDICVGPTVKEDEKFSLLQLLNTYRMCSAKTDFELGCTSYIEMDIVEKSNCEPVQCKPYKASAEQREIMRGIVKGWKAAGLVKETNSSYASPCLLVQKADGTWRLVVDYRRLNKNTVRINFPLQRVDDGLENLHGARIFAILDLARGYLQIPLTEQAKEKTAFITPDETGQFERAIFGLMNAPFYFAKLMKKVFGNYGNKLALCFFDDMLVYAGTWEELLGKIEKILQLLKDAGLTLNLDKCKFGLESVSYLGMIIGKDGLGPGENKVKAISQFPTPRNIHEARRFHGMASYFRRFIPNFARIAGPIIELFKKEGVFVWGERQERAFQEIKQKLSSGPVLMHYNPKSERTELHTDASAEGLGAILLQENEKGELHPVYAISKRTSEVERSYHSSKLELLAIVWALERLRPWVIGIPFKVITDCQALVYLNSLKTKNAQIVRWLGMIAEFDCEIHHRKGEHMQHVDALSRAPLNSDSSELEKGIVFNVLVHEDEILMHQCSDDKLKRKIQILGKPVQVRSRREKGEVLDYVLRNGLLYKIDGENRKELYVVPCSMRKAVVLKNHDFCSHFGLDRTIARIRNYYYFPGMRRYVRKHIASCIECILGKNKVGKQAGELHPIPVGKRPFEVINVDHLGPFVTTLKKNKYLLAATCNFTKFCQL